MKKGFIFIFCFYLIFCCACSNKNSQPYTAENQAHISNVDTIISNQITNFENSDSFNEETIKTLAVILRTNLLTNQNTTSLSEINENILNSDIYNIVKTTNGEIVKDESEQINEFFIEDEKLENQEWCVTIKKSKILELLKKNNISLSNLSNFEIIKNEDDYTEKIIIAGKEFDIDYLMKEFDLPSNKNLTIVNNLTTVKITGKGTHKNDTFNLKTIKSLSYQGYDYKNIIKSKKNSFKIINNT